VLGRFLRFLLERVEYINCLLKIMGKPIIFFAA